MSSDVGDLGDRTLPPALPHSIPIIPIWRRFEHLEGFAGPITAMSRDGIDLGGGRTLRVPPVIPRSKGLSGNIPSDLVSCPLTQFLPGKTKVPRLNADC